MAAITCVDSHDQGTCPTRNLVDMRRKVGSSLGAELGSMRVTEQIDAMEVSAINPFKYLVVTRVLATTITIPLLMCYTGFVGMMGSYLDVHITEQTGLSLFFQEHSKELVSRFYRFIRKIYCLRIHNRNCWMLPGILCIEKGTEGVGKAANTSVVLAMFLIFIEEILIVQVFNSFRSMQ